MTETGKSLIKIATMGVPAIVLYFTLYGGPKGTGVGGGGYDLSELMYGGIFVIYLVVWNVWMLIALVAAKTPAAKQSNTILLVVGIIALIATAAWFIKFLR